MIKDNFDSKDFNVHIFGYSMEPTEDEFFLNHFQKKNYEKL